MHCLSVGFLWLLAVKLPLPIQSGSLPATDSDYLYLYMTKSSIPLDVGMGVFAKVDIPAGEIICEYRGPMIDFDIPYGSDKKFRATTREGRTYSILGDTICAMINDPVWVVNKTYTPEEIESFKNSPREDVIPLYPGLAYNANYVPTAMGKVFIYATAFIPANTEIFFPYGRWYWIPTIETGVLPSDFAKTAKVVTQP